MILPRLKDGWMDVCLMYFLSCPICVGHKVMTSPGKKLEGLGERRTLWHQFGMTYLEKYRMVSLSLSLTAAESLDAIAQTQPRKWAPFCFNTLVDQGKFGKRSSQVLHPLGSMVIWLLSCLVYSSSVTRGCCAFAGIAHPEGISRLSSLPHTPPSGILVHLRGIFCVTCPVFASTVPAVPWV